MGDSKLTTDAEKAAVVATTPKQQELLTTMREIQKLDLSKVQDPEVRIILSKIISIIGLGSV